MRAFMRLLRHLNKDAIADVDVLLVQDRLWDDDAGRRADLNEFSLHTNCIIIDARRMSREAKKSHCGVFLFRFTVPGTILLSQDRVGSKYHRPWRA